MLLERVSAIWMRAKALVHRRRLDRDLDEELTFHLMMRASKYGGDSAAARRQFGNPAQIRETCRELWTFFALLALALGAIGIYGIVAYRVAHRTAEIGVRMALGAQKGDVLWLIMRETLVLLAIGAAVGVPAALAAARLIKSLLFALAPSDPLTIACATLVLFGAGAMAGFLPARRAASVEPTLALRGE